MGIGSAEFRQWFGFKRKRIGTGFINIDAFGNIFPRIPASSSTHPDEAEDDSVGGVDEDSTSGELIGVFYTSSCTATNKLLSLLYNSIETMPLGEVLQAQDFH